MLKSHTFRDGGYYIITSTDVAGMYLWIVIGILVIVVGIGAYLYAPPSDVIPEGDVIMSIKSSRPGCEESDKCYVPSEITVLQGGQVTWVNEDSAFHSVTSGTYGNDTGIFDSGYMDPYESYVITFDDAGTFEYFCTLHPWMAGQVIVSDVQ